jgi:PKD repeat protein
MTADGTITITLDLTNPLNFHDTSGRLAPFTLNRPPAGITLTGVQGVTSLLVGAAPGGIGGGATVTVSSTGATQSYKTVGNINCSAGVPVAGLTATPMSGPPALNVNFDASSSIDTSVCATIATYTLDFGDGSTPVTHSSPLFPHTYQNAGTYAARLTATDTAGRVSNSAQVVINVTSTQVQPTGVVSRKIHGNAGTFDITLPSTGVGIEPRGPGATGTNGVDYQLVFVFPNTLSSVANVTASATGAAQPNPPSGSINPNNAHQYIVNINGVPNAQRLTVTLHNVLDSTGAAGNVSKTVGILLGDVNQNGVVDSGDVFLVRQKTGQTASASNFRQDVNATGVIDSGDVFVTRQHTATALP